MASPVPGPKALPDPSLTWVLPAAKEAYDNREAIQGLWDRLATLLLGKKQSIGFTGLGGVGKTVLFDHLTGAAYRPGYTPPGTSRHKEKGKVSRHRKRMHMTVVPGQDSPARLEVTDDLFGAKPVDGVVHVVANGFVELRSGAARETLVRTGLQTIESFRQHQLEQELRDLDLTCEMIRASMRNNDKPKWMIVVSDKVDLYYDSVLEAEKYYSPGSGSKFSARIEEMQNRVGRDRFDWVAAPACAWLEDFEWNGQVVPSKLKPLDRDYFIGQLIDLIGAYCER